MKERDLGAERRLLDAADPREGTGWREHVEARLAQGERDYGDAWARRDAAGLVGEAVEELVDAPAWLLLATQALDGEADPEAIRALIVPAMTDAARGHARLLSVLASLGQGNATGCREKALAGAGSALTRTLVLDATPPSLNVVAGRRWQWVRAKRRWQADLETAAMAVALPRGLARVEATAILTFPTRRRRDEGNFRALLEKALGDALVNGRWLADDTPDLYSFGAITFAEGAPRTAIHLRCLRGSGA